MALNDIGLEVPAGTDMFDPDGDMRALGISLMGRVIIPVANTAEKDALATLLNPTPANPLYVHRADAPVFARLEWTDDGGTTWRGIYGGAVGWVDCPKVAGWAGTCVAKMVGRVIEIRADLTSGPNIPAGAFYTFANLPASIPAPTADPGLNARGQAWMGADGGQAYCTPSGAIGVINGTGSIRNAVTCSIIYLES